MKRRIALAIAFTLSVVLVSLASSDSTVQAQQGIRKVADTGVVSLGPNQELRLTLFGDTNGDAKVDAADYVLFRRIEYGQESCSSDGVCKLVVTSQTASNPIRLAPGEAASLADLNRFAGDPVADFGARSVGSHVTRVVPGSNADRI